VNQFSAANKEEAGFNFKDWQQTGRVKNARMKEQQQNIRLFLTISLALLGVFGIVELVFKVYDFNNKGHNNDEKLLREEKRRKLG